MCVCVRHPPPPYPPLWPLTTRPSITLYSTHPYISHRNTPPIQSKSKPPTLYIFSFKHLRTFSLSFKLTTMTKHRQLVLDFIRAYIRLHGVPPSYEVIAKGIGLSSKSNTPGVYIFSFKHLRTFVFAFKLQMLGKRGGLEIP